MLRFVDGKPLSNISAEIVNRPQEQNQRVLETPLPVQQREPPLPEVNLTDEEDTSPDDEELVEHSPAHHRSPPRVHASETLPPRNQFSPLSEIRRSFSENEDENAENEGNSEPQREKVAQRKVRIRQSFQYCCIAHVDNRM